MAFDETPHCPPLLTPTQAAARSSSGFPAKTPVMGHHVPLTTRDLGSGVNTTWILVPAKGTSPGLSPTAPIFRCLVLAKLVIHLLCFLHQFLGHQNPSAPLLFCTKPSATTHHHDNQPALGRLPKLPFPKFDGDNPRRWCSRCEKYFRMYEVDQPVWISLVEHYVEGRATIWYQSISS